jgi:hypothetical protein
MQCTHLYPPAYGPVQDTQGQNINISLRLTSFLDTLVVCILTHHGCYSSYQFWQPNISNSHAVNCSLYIMIKLTCSVANISIVTRIAIFQGVSQETWLQGLLGRHRHRWEYYIKKYLGQICVMLWTGFMWQARLDIVTFYCSVVLTCEVLTVVIMKITVLWDVRLCSLLGKYRQVLFYVISFCTVLL